MANAVMKRISSVVSYNIICVHVGNKYSNDYVEKLYNSCVRHSAQDFTFTILHDANKNYTLRNNNIRFINVEPMNFLHNHNLWWYKLQSFRQDVATAEQNLLLDLDIVLVNKIDKFWNYNPNKFVVLQDFNRHWFPNYNRCNSSIVKFTPKIASDIFNSFMTNPIEYVRKFRGDQDYLDQYVVDKVWWPKKWAMSWKWEVYNGGMVECNSTKYYDTTTNIDADTSMLVFHGKPDPHDIKDNIIKGSWL